MAMALSPCLDRVDKCEISQVLKYIHPARRAYVKGREIIPRMAMGRCNPENRYGPDIM